MRGAAGLAQHLAVRGQRAGGDGGGAPRAARRGGAPRPARAPRGRARRRARPLLTARAPRRATGTYFYLLKIII